MSRVQYSYATSFILFFVFVLKLSFFLYFYMHLFYEMCKTNQYFLASLRVFEYYSEITNGLNAKFEWYCELQIVVFEYRIIQIICCNSALFDTKHTYNNLFDVSYLSNHQLKSCYTLKNCFFF